MAIAPIGGGSVAGSGEASTGKDMPWPSERAGFYALFAVVFATFITFLDQTAFGLLAEKTSLPWNAVFSVDSNYRAKVDALSEILDIL